jgi:hypothetical protein
VTGPDAWRARAAEANAALDSAVRESQRAERELRESPRFQQRLQDIEEYARGRAASRALRDLQHRIDAGELSWPAILDGNHLDDPTVRAALATSIAEPAPPEADDDPPRGYAFTHFDPDADD